MNNYYLFLCIVSLIFCAVTYDPAVNKKHPESEKYCIEYWPYIEDNETYRFKDSDNDANSPKGVSDWLIINYGIYLTKDIMIDAALLDINIEVINTVLALN